MFITLQTAKVHLREEAPDESDLALKLDAAELATINYLDRAVFVSKSALEAAVALAPANLVNAKAEFIAANTAADLIKDYELCIIEKAYASNVYSQAVFAAARTRRGIVINPLIQAAMLLFLGDLWEARENTVIGASVEAIPDGAYRLLGAYRYYNA